MQYRHAILRDEFGTGKVRVWNLDNLQNFDLTAGTSVLIVSAPAISGYVTCRVADLFFEVWHECLLGPASKRLN
jgi:hypothetical protein